MARVDRRRQLGLLFIVGVHHERLNPTIAREVPRYEQVPGRWGTQAFYHRDVNRMAKNGEERSKSGRITAAGRSKSKIKLNEFMDVQETLEFSATLPTHQPPHINRSCR